MGSHYIYKDSLADNSNLVFQSNLHEYLNYAHKALFKTRKDHRYITEKDLIHSPDEIEGIQNIMTFILELIGKNSNERFSQQAEKQDNFFSKNSETETFFLHLFISVQSHKARKRNFEEHPAPYINQDHLLFKTREGNNTYHFSCKGKIYTEKQIYAAGMYYIVPFVIKALHQNDAIHTSRLLSRMSHFMNGIDYALTISQKGGKKTSSKKIKEREEAYKLFCENKIYEKYGPMHEPMAATLQSVLRDHKIRRTHDTLKTKWIPDFIKRYKKS